MCIFFAFVFCCNAQNVYAAKPEGRIIYIENTDHGTTCITSINADGTNKKRLTSTEFFFARFPRYCKKSGWIGFTNMDRSNMIPEIILLNKGKVKPLKSGAKLEDFSPDGKSVIYTTLGRNPELHVYNLFKKTDIHIAEGEKVLSARWSDKTGDIIASVISHDGTADLIMISGKDYSVSKLTKSNYISEVSPVFTPDGKNIICSSDADEVYHVEYMNVSAKNRQSTDLKGIFPCSSPDSKWFVYENDMNIYISSKSGDKNIFLVEGNCPIWVK